MPDGDLMSLHHSAMNGAYDKLAEQERALAGKAQRPAVPLSDDPDELLATKPADKRTRVMEYAMLRADPERLAATIGAEMARLGLPAHKPYPRRLVEELVEMEKLYQEEQERLAKTREELPGIGGV